MTVTSKFFGLAACVLASVVSLAPVAQACDHSDEDGLDVALVLSGGGALASTQVGALQIIEDAGVPLHCVVGTSMGSAIGALYVSGYSANEIHEIFTTDDWGAIFRGGIERDKQPFLRKEDSELYFSNYVAGLDEDGIRLPGGAGTMSGLRLKFRELMSHVPIESDFSTDLELPIQLIATDLSTGEAVAFENGDIVESVLASMAVPGAFAPREIDGRVFVDGGMSAQLGVSFAKQAGADVVIAIDTTVTPPQVDARVNAITTFRQLIRISVFENAEEQKALLTDEDLLIQPDLSGLSTSSFDKFETGYQSGRAETEKVLSKLQKINAMARPSARREIEPAAQSLDLAKLIVRNETGVDDELIRRRLDKPDRAQIVRLNQKNRLESLAAFGGFGEIDLGYLNDRPVLTVKRRGLGENLLQIGAIASNTFDGDSRFSLAGRLTQRPVSASGGEFSLALALGSDLGVAAAWNQPFGYDGRLFVEPSVFYSAEQVRFNLGDIRIGEFWEQRVGARARAGRELGNWGIFALETEAAFGSLDPRISDEQGLEKIRYEQGRIGALFAIDTLNRTDWPTDGVQFRTVLTQIYDLEDTSSTTTKLGVEGLGAIGSDSTGLILTGRYQDLGTDLDEPTEFLSLGGFRQLSAFPENSLPASSLSYGSIEVFNRLTPSDRILNLPVYAGLLGEVASAEFDLFQPVESDDFYSLSAYLGAITPIGPVYFGAAVGSDDQSAVYLHLGRSF